MLHMLSKKGQVQSLDLFISATVFIILLVTLILVWDNFSKRLDNKIAYEDLSEKAIKITDILVETRGVPDKWENDADKVNVIGLVSNDRVLSSNKIEEFIDMEYDDVRELFNIEAYDFYFRIIDSNGALIQVHDNDVELGNKPSLSSKFVITIQRIVLNGGSEVVLEFTLWE
ncbi:hypothetical protein HYV88_04770 [Candidatus Woesearchaeota archaeon]|nr:hypothetical protein [Candidatus Woesearchaeota archaeon]